MSRVVESVAEALLDSIGDVSDATRSSIERAENGMVIVKCRPNPIETVYGEELVTEAAIHSMGHAVSMAAYHSLEPDNFQLALQTNAFTKTTKYSPKVGEEVLFVGNAKVGGSILDPILQFDAWVERDEGRFLLATGTSSVGIQRHGRVENVPEIAHAPDARIDVDENDVEAEVPPEDVAAGIPGVDASDEDGADGAAADTPISKVLPDVSVEEKLAVVSPPSLQKNLSTQVVQTMVALQLKTSSDARDEDATGTSSGAPRPKKKQIEASDDVKPATTDVVEMGPYCTGNVDILFQEFMFVHLETPKPETGKVLLEKMKGLGFTAIHIYHTRTFFLTKRELYFFYFSVKPEEYQALAEKVYGNPRWADKLHLDSVIHDFRPILAPAMTVSELLREVLLATMRKENEPNFSHGKSEKDLVKESVAYAKKKYQIESLLTPEGQQILNDIERGVFRRTPHFSNFRPLRFFFVF
ncbi:hypothetical protein B9Z55_008409 [Caenorhabditis nigoni]|uniref:Uncharacterized protein n=1 Tax=Caenorhabditis nigoni TaxID=1611254 RepID=A0A2G5UNG9_9PELO|nr:hypothetical protein B9Z55_008409 [Caenorhabditis nigoni]